MKRIALWLVLLAVLGMAWLGFEPPSMSGEKKQNRVGHEAPLAPANEELPGGFSEEMMGRLESWLRSAEASGSSPQKATLRDIFRKGAEPAQTAPPSAEAPEPRIEAVLPRLTGFVLEGTQNGPVAAIRYEGRMWLVEVGDTFGPYRVAKLVAGEEVLLVEVESGEELLLVLN